MRETDYCILCVGKKDLNLWFLVFLIVIPIILQDEPHPTTQQSDFTPTVAVAIVTTSVVTVVATARKSVDCLMG